MRTRWTVALLLSATIAGAPASAQAPSTHSGVMTETMHRQHFGGQSDLISNLIGCLGLFGLTGLWRRSDNDGYTADPI